jgi:MFS family permease
MAPIALAFGVLDLTGSVGDLGLVLACGSVPFVVLVLIGGVWADRVSRLRVMALTGTVSTVSQALVGVLLVTGRATVLELALLTALQGTARAFGAPAIGALIPDTVSPQRLQQATALLYTSSSTIDIGGAALGGLLVAVIGPGWTMLFNAATSAAEVAIRFLMRLTETMRTVEERASFRRDFTEGWTAVRSRRWLLAMLLSAAAFSLVVTGPYDALGPQLARHSLGGPKAWGLIQAAFSLGALAGVASVLRVRLAHPLRAAALLNLLFIPVLALFAIPGPLWAILAAAFLGGASNDAYLVLFDTTIQRLIPRGLLARVISFDWFSDAATRPISLAVIGPLTTHLGMPTLFWIAAIGVGVLMLLTLSVSEVRTTRADPPK